MANTLDQLVEQVQAWSVDKNLHNGNPDRQALKFYEEAGKLHQHYLVDKWMH